MSRRFKQTALLISDEVKFVVSRIADETGWTVNEARSFLVLVGWNAINGGADTIPGFRRVMQAAISHHKTGTPMKKRLAITAGKLRNAQSAFVPKTGGGQ